MGRPPFQPNFSDLPPVLPLFPLTGALLMPQGQLPLNIFEPRYLAMVFDALGQGRMIGMIQPQGQGGSPAGEPPSLYKVGCAGRISSFAEADQGRLLITLAGVCRFRLAEEVEIVKGYRRARIDWEPFRRDLDVEQTPQIDRPRLIAGLRAYLRQQNMDLNWSAVDAASDLALVLSLPMVCPFAPSEKQALLECAEISSVAQTLIALFDLALAEGPDGSPPRPPQ